jgi:hypothetical protein
LPTKRACEVSIMVERADRDGAGSLDLLENSACRSDEGELVGKDPRDVPSQVLSLKFSAQNRLKAIRAKCLDCCCGNAAEVRKCVAVDCPSWPFRMGKDPFRKKRTLSPEQRKQTAARLRPRPKD